MNTQSTLGEHAVVIGGSIAGLLAARALSDHFARVTVLERDPISADPQARTFTASVAHLSEFAAGVRPRPLNSLYLPVLSR